MTSPISSAGAGSPIILGVSLGSPGGSLAIAKGRLLEQVSWDTPASASELVTVRLLELLRRLDLEIADLTHVLVNHGPGSFTGIRVAVNLARALGFSLDIPVATLSALAVLAQEHVPARDRRVIALKAVRDYYYVAEFARADRELTCLCPPRSMRRDDPVLNRTDVLIEGITAGFNPAVDAQTLVSAAFAQPRLTSYFSWDEARPLYVRGSEAEEKLRK